MKISWNLLSHSGFIKPWPKTLKPEQVAQQLTMAGLELEQLESSADGDMLLDLNITPNRGDCLSVRGLCREIAALNDLPFHDVETLTHHERSAFACDGGLQVDAPAACPLYAGQWFRVPLPLKALPAEINDALVASGIALVHPIVDLTNYVMLVLGQPLHAFDADKIQALDVRFAKANETFVALGNRSLTLNDTTLVIADGQGVQAIAGVIGGLHSAVSADTAKVFIESAHFAPATISGKARAYGLQTDAAFRFERGVDPALPLIALKLFKKLALKHLNLGAGGCVSVGEVEKVVKRLPIFLHAQRIERLLGFNMHTGQIEKILHGLGMSVVAKPQGWHVTPLSSRFDIHIEEDLIEELVRILGYDAIPAAPIRIEGLAQAQAHEPLSTLLVHAAYHEVISYSFISESLHSLCFGDAAAIRLKNPLSSELAVMRLSLWPSLLQTYLYNQARQQNNAKLYENGLIYLPEMSATTGTYEQPRVLAGLLTGTAHAEEWSAPTRTVDFFDIKADVEQLLQVFAPLASYRFDVTTHSMLHPGQAAAIYWGETRVGTLGRLHPQLQQTLACHQPVFLFELLLDQLPVPQTPVFAGFSKYPTIKRQFAFFVKRDLPMQDFCALITDHLGARLVDFRLFDIYQGKGVAADEKSVAFSIIVEDPEQTWSEHAIAQLSDDLVALIRQRFGARLRDGHS